MSGSLMTFEVAKTPEMPIAVVMTTFLGLTLASIATTGHAKGDQCSVQVSVDRLAHLSSQLREKRADHDFWMDHQHTVRVD